MMKVFSVLLLAVGVLAAPAPAPAPEPFNPIIPQTYNTRPAQLIESSLLAQTDPIQIAKLHASLDTEETVSLDSIRVASSHVNKRNGVTHVYLQQVVHGLDVMNGVANVNVDAGHRVVSAGNSFFKNAARISSAPVSSVVKISASDAVAAFSKFITHGAASQSVASLQVSASGPNSFTVTGTGAQFVAKPIQANQKYIQTSTGELRLVWELEMVEMSDGSDSIFDAALDAETGEVLYLHDLVSRASTYNVFPFGRNDPLDGPREVIDDPAHPVASPYGWHSQGILGVNFTNTQGNNVHASENPIGDTDYTNKYRPDGGVALNFDFPLNLNLDPLEYKDVAITNLFYMSNMIHDFYYVYGFDEEAGNFQRNNFDRGGTANDPVITFAQDGGGTNNANFYTPRDGLEGRMRMYLWTGTPRRDGDLDGGIIVHEYGHGLSTRLTGGPTNVGCLNTYEPGGMGEGWGDIIATVIRTNSTTTRAQNYNMGGYANGNPDGIRKYIYSTDMNTNPSTYAFISDSDYMRVHRVGEVWAVILYDIYWNLVDEYGFDSNWFNARSPAGNIVFIQLLIDGMKLQPCSPNFVQARDAILQADELDYGGWYKCALWRGFAKRGVGVSAVGGTNWGPSWSGREAFDLPAECQA